MDHMAVYFSVELIMQIGLCLFTKLLLIIFVILFLFFLTFCILKYTTEAVPKKILELMNVPGLTRENVASHLQVWWCYVS